MLLPVIRHLDLFSGVGGFALAAQMVGGIETRQFVEIDHYCQSAPLPQNFPGVPIHDDATTFTAQPGQFDLVTAGFPCQDISAANPRGRGLEGERSGLFFEIIRIVRECRPRYLVLENSPALLTSRGGRDMGTILWALAESGFDAEWQVVSAASVGAEHLRERLFIVAYPNAADLGLAGRGLCKPTRAKASVRPPCTVPIQRLVPETFGEGDAGDVRGRARIPNRVDRIKALGNAVFPHAAAVPLRRILELEATLEFT